MNKTHLIIARDLRKWIRKVKKGIFSHSELIRLRPLFWLSTGVSEALFWLSTGVSEALFWLSI